MMIQRCLRRKCENVKSQYLNRFFSTRGARYLDDDESLDSILEKIVLKKAYERDRETSTLCEVLVNRKQTLRAVRSISRHCDSDMFRDMLHTRRVLAIGMYREGNPKTAIKLVSTRNAVGANALIYEMAKDPKNQEEDSIVQDLLDSMLFTNTCTYNGLMRHARHSFNQANKRFEEMLEKGLVPNATTFVTLYDSVQTQKDLDFAEIQFAPYESQYQTQQPLRLSRARAMLRANDMIRATREVKLHLNQQSKEALVKTFFKHRNARMLKDRIMTERGMLSSVPSFNTIMAYLETTFRYPYSYDHIDNILHKYENVIVNHHDTTKSQYGRSVRARARHYAKSKQKHGVLALFREYNSAPTDLLDSRVFHDLMVSSTRISSVDTTMRMLATFGGRSSKSGSEKTLCAILREVHTIEQLESACENLLPVMTITYGVIPTEKTSSEILNCASRIVAYQDIGLSSEDSGGSGLKVSETRELANLWYEDKNETVSPAKLMRNLVRTCIESSINLVEPLARLKHDEHENDLDKDEIDDAIRDHYNSMYELLSELIQEWNAVDLLPIERSM
jgi:hypothetical protein